MPNRADLMPFKAILAVTIILVAICFTACSRDPGKRLEIKAKYGSQPSKDELMLAGSINSLAFKLYHDMTHPEHPMLYSPYGLAVALSMAYGGADGETRSELAETLSFQLGNEQHHTAFAMLQKRLADSGFVVAPPAPDKPPEEPGIAVPERFPSRSINMDHETRGLFTVNALLVARDVEPHLQKAYLTLLKRKYAVRHYAFGSDREGVEMANAWAAAQSHGKIGQLLSPQDIPPDGLGAVLLNAVNFSGKWKLPFATQNTTEMPFYKDVSRSFAADGPYRSVEMMHGQARFQYAESEGLQMLEMPYLEGAYSMVVLLPDSLASLERNFTLARFQSMYAALQDHLVDVYIPAFGFPGDNSGLKQALAKLGIRSAFSAADADFTAMAELPPGENLYMDKLIQKTYIEVFEEGTIAKAVIALSFSSGGAGMGPEEKDAVKLFLADHPFIFAIVHQPTGCIIFMGNYK
jgi:serpin B